LNNLKQARKDKWADKLALKKACAANFPAASNKEKELLKKYATRASEAVTTMRGLKKTASGTTV
jgi:hypothetical protein